MPVKKKHSRRRVLFLLPGNYPSLSKAAQRRATARDAPSVLSAMDGIAKDGRDRYVAGTSKLAR